MKLHCDKIVHMNSSARSMALLTQTAPRVTAQIHSCGASAEKPKPSTLERVPL